MHRARSAATDALIPFPDTVEVCAKAGCTVVVHTGGSIRDEDSVAAANELGVSLNRDRRAPLQALTMASVDLVIPCYNEAHVLAGSVERTLAFLEAHPEHNWRIVIADNASTDRTLEVAQQLEAAHPARVAALHIPVKGRGLALRNAWLTSDADVCAYMDVDLSDRSPAPAGARRSARGTGG